MKIRIALFHSNKILFQKRMRENKTDQHNKLARRIERERGREMRSFVHVINKIG